MKHFIFTKNTQYKIALLIKDTAFDENKLRTNYIEHTSVDEKDIIAFNLLYKENGKAPAGFCRAYLDILLKALNSLKVDTLFVCDGNYFKILTGVRKIEGSHGYIKPCVIKGYEHMNVILSVNYQGLFYNPNLQEYVDLSLKTLDSHINGIHIDIGSNIIHSAEYPNSIAEVGKALKKLHKHPELTCDVETYSLKFYNTPIATIAFAWDKHNGIAFCVDMDREDDEVLKIKNLLRKFLVSYKGTLIYHNANFDMKIIINDLFMDNLLDQEGMIKGINLLTKNFDDTKLITYLAVNSCAGNKLKLKIQAHEFAGDYAVEVTDIATVPVKDLLQYNLIDCLATWYVKEKHEPTMIADNQLPVYKNIIKPSVKPILQMELSGIPLDMPAVYKAEKELNAVCATATKQIFNNPIIIEHTDCLRKEECLKMNIQWKRKREPLEYFDYIEFNPASNPQLQELLYDRLDLPILDKTKSKQPAVGGKTLKKLLNHTIDPEILSLLNALMTLATAKKILDTFIKAFIESSVLKGDGIWYLHGNFNLGGTVSGRLSSSGPNLQNIPSNSTYAKLIKKCFISPKDWLLCGADFDSLEDKISALTTKDPNKLKVYTDGYDGHCLRAYSYFGHDMKGIVNTVDSINSIADLYPDFRQNSKAPTFALTYQGTWHTLVNNLGISEGEAKIIEKNYHTLYSVSDEWIQDKLIEASSTGYVTVAFGLRVRTPILKQTMLNKKSTPFEAAAESRTAGNALGQSYGLLNNRAAIEFQNRVLNSKFWADIKPIMQIHDSMYFLVRNRLEVVKWFNDNLPDCMSWQKLPEIQHDVVRLSGKTEIFYPNWSVKTTLPNYATEQEIVSRCQNT